MSQRLGQELNVYVKERFNLRGSSFGGRNHTTIYESAGKGQRKSASFEVMTNISKFYGIPLDYFAQFIDDEQSEVHNLSETELEIWSALNNKVKEEIYYKKGDLLADWLRSFFVNHEEAHSFFRSVILFNFRRKISINSSIVEFSSGELYNLG